VVYTSSDNSVAQKQLHLKLKEGTLKNLKVEFEGPDFVQFTYVLEGNDLEIKMKILGQNYGDHEGKIFIIHDEVKYVIPFLIHYTEGSISVSQQDGKLDFMIHHPLKWNFAKISIINSKDGKTETTTSTPERNASIKVYENGEYWIEAKIKVNEKTFDAFNTIEVNSVNENTWNKFELKHIPERQIAIVSGIILCVGIIGIIKTVKA